MEFPHLGQHCSEPTCNRLDFLPVKCDSCDKVFCASHYNYERHNCPGAYKKNVQVPICPLCREPVPTPPGVEPDVTVGQHIDQQCKSESKKIYTNRCHAKGCKRKELIPVKCSACHLNFCLRHRHTSDHDCQPASSPAPAAAASSSSSGGGGWQSIFKSSDTRSMAAQAAERRRQSKQAMTSSGGISNSRPRVAVQAAQVQTIQGNMSEDEALARALALSIMEQDDAAESNRQQQPTPSQNNSQQVAVGGGNQQGSTKDKCLLS